MNKGKVIDVIDVIDVFQLFSFSPYKAKRDDKAVIHERVSAF